MPSKRYLLVDKCILPDYYEKVIEARALISSGKVANVSDAVKMVGISRGTYYKYKDYVFALNSDTECRKAVISFTLYHKSGILSEVLNFISENGANILTITQNLPVNKRANVVLSLDVSQLTTDISEILEQLGAKDGVTGTKLLAIE
jgi:chorismate mutase